MRSFLVGRRRRAIVIIAAALVPVLVGGTFAWRLSSSQDPTLKGSPAASLDAIAARAPDIVPRVAAAELTASDGSGPIVTSATSFRLTALDGSQAAELAARLTVEPPLELTVEPGSDGRAVVLRPTEPLVAGAVYRFTLAGPAGEELDSWAFQAQRPVRVVGTLPSHQATDVPLDSGIEITFDQDGVTDPAAFVTIEPATKGRFEQHGRVLAFVPESLDPATIYSVTVRSGVTVAATGETMAEDVTFEFETAAKGAHAESTTTEFPGDLVEALTGSPPVIGMWAFNPDGEPVGRVKVDVYRFADLDAAIAAFRQIRAAPRWSRLSGEQSVDPSGLSKVLSVDTELMTGSDSSWIRLPEPLEEGWYLLHDRTGTRPSQAVLQVTDLAGYVAVSETRTVVWANDAKAATPIAGAVASTPAGELGRTGADGLLITDTPAALRPVVGRDCADRCDPVVIMRDGRGRSTFLPVSGRREKGDSGGSFWGGEEANSRFWVVLQTDRTTYRPTDTINVWGVIRARGSGDVPASVGLQLGSSWDGRPVPPVARSTAVPRSTGVFVASIPITDLAHGAYSVSLVVGGEVVRGTELSVAPIAKPAYRLDAETGRRIYVRGDRIRLTARATFYDGTPVPGVPLRLSESGDARATTDASGTAVYRTVAKPAEDAGGVDYRSISVSPARAEEGEISTATRDFLVYPARRTIDAESRIAGGKVIVGGGVHALDIDRLEREVLEGGSIWELDPRGKAAEGVVVTARFVELIPVKERTGSDYDFVEKRVVPIYSYSVTERDAGTRRVRTDAAGRYAASVPSAGDHDYRVEVSVEDADGLPVTASTNATADAWFAGSSPPVGLYPTAGGSEVDGFGIDQPVDLTMLAADGRPARGSDDRYLFFVAQGGIRAARVQASPRFVVPFDSTSIPNVDIGGVRFTGRGYVSGGIYRAAFRHADRQLDVELSVGSRRYEPRDRVTVDVTTRNSQGRPVAATVVIRAVDEKLYSIGAADDTDPLPALYGHLSNGIIGTYGSHGIPRQDTSGGDTTGGGEDRTDFRDWLVFSAIETGPDGRGSVTFDLSDDLTSWRVTASAVTAGLEAGLGSVQVPVGLPFFVDASLASEYLVADHPTLVVRTFGSAVEPGDAVTIEVESTTLGLRSGPLKAKVFATVGVPLPELTVGRHSVTITATTGAGSEKRTDRLTRTFSVVESRLTRARTQYGDVDAAWRVDGGPGLTTVILSDASAGQYMAELAELALGGSNRLDRGIAAAVASGLLADRFGPTGASVPASEFSPLPYQTPGGGLALLPYASSDLELSTLVAIAAPNSVDRSRLQSYLAGIRSSKDETRERRTYALAGLAGLGAPVLSEIQSAAGDETLTVRERLVVGLGATAIGDQAAARSVAASLASKYGESIGQSARIRVGPSATDVTTGTAMMAVLAASIGDPSAGAYWRYVEANPSPESPFALESLAFVARVLDRLPHSATRLAYTVDGARTVVELAPGEALELILTAEQRASLRVETLSGAVGATVSWREPVAPGVLRPDPDVTIRRQVTPVGTIASDDLVRVDLELTLDPRAAAGCHHVTDLLPSGLVPVGERSRWVDDGEDAPATGAVVLPYAQDTHSVRFCAEPRVGERTVTMRYVARVVTPGRYRWEPAIADSRTDSGLAAMTPTLVVEVR